MTQTLPCPACGAPNASEAGQIRTACAYCGASITIPEHLQTKPKVAVEAMPPKTRPVISPEIDAADLLRKAQPVALGAWNLFAAWTWLRRLIPACLVVLVLFILLCIALGALPFILNLVR